MGVVRKQGAYRTAINYLAAFIGGVSTILIYPLDYDTYGKIQFVLAVSMFLQPLLTWGTQSLSVRFFPDFDQKGEGQNGFLAFLLSSVGLSVGFSLLLLFLFREQFYGFLDWLRFDVDLFQEHFPVILALIVLLAFIEILRRYTSNFAKVVVPELFANVLMKIGVPLVVLGIYYGLVQPDFYKPYILVLHLLVLGGLIIYLVYLKKWHLSWPRKGSIDKKLRRDMLGYVVYGLVGSLGSVLAFNIDAIMVAGFEGAFSTGQYANSRNIAKFIGLPYVALSAISSPIIAKAIHRKSWDEVERMYVNSSLNLGWLGLLIYGLLLVNLGDLFSFAPDPEKMEALKWPVYVLGGAVFFDMLSGLNKEIMGFSHLYRFNLVLIGILAGTNIAANYLLIPHYGILGAAMATFGSLALVNIVRTLYIYIRLKKQPFRRRTVAFILVLGAAIALILQLPSTGYPLLNMVIRSGLLASIALAGAYYFNWSPLFRDIIQGVIDRYLKWR